MKRPLLILSLIVLSMLCASQSFADAKAEAQKVLDEIAKAYNSRDAGFLNYWTNDAVFSGASGAKAEGKAEIKKLLDSKLGDSKAHISSLTVTSAQLVQDDVAIINGTIHVDEEGQDSLDAKFVGVFVKDVGSWKIKSWTSSEVIIAPSKIDNTTIIIHVVNGTTETLEFALYIQGEDGKSTRIPETKLIAPGKSQGWLLAEGTKLSHKDQLYPIGLIGKSKSGKQHNWGIVEAKTDDAGMVGVEKTLLSKSFGEENKVRHIAIKPIPQ